MQTLILPAHYLKSRKSNGVPNIQFIEDMDHKRVSMGARMGFGGEAMCEVIDARTEKPVPFQFGNQMVMQTPWVHNLIMNVGMNYLGTDGLASIGSANTSNNPLARSFVGSGSSQDKTASGGVTATQSGTDITLSGSLSAVQSERVIKWDSGETAFILSGGGTSWTARESQAVGSGPFTVFHVNRTTLDAGLRATQIDSTASITNNVSEGWRRYTGVFTHGAESSSRNYNEIAWSWNTSATANIFNRIVLPASVTVEIGQQIRVTLRFNITLSPITPQSAGGFSVIGWDTGAITQQVCAIASITDAMNPPNNMSMATHVQSSLPSLSEFSGIPFVSNSFGSLVVQSYATNSFSREIVSNWTTAQGNGSGIRGLAPAVPGGGGRFACLFANSVTKANTHTLSVRFRRSWDRAYV